MQAILLALLPSLALAAPLMSIDTYLDQVSRQSPAIKAARASAEGAELIGNSADLITTPYLFGNAGWLDDKKETFNPSFMGTRTKAQQYALGLTSNTPLGLNLTYSYNLAHTEVMGAPILPLPNYYAAYNKIEATQSLLANGFGTGTRARVAAAEATPYAAAYR